MADPAQGATPRPRPAAPPPLPVPASPLALLRAMRRNPLTAIPDHFYDQPIIRNDTFVGPVIIVSEPGAIHRVLVANASNYVRDVNQGRMLDLIVGSSLITAEGEEWRRQRRQFAPLFRPDRAGAVAAGVENAARTMVGEWSARAEGSTFAAAIEMERAMLLVLEQTLLPDGIPADHERLAETIIACFDTVGSVDLASALDLPVWVPRTSVLKSWRQRRRLRLLTKQIVAAASRRPAVPDTASNLVSILLGRDESGKRLFSDADIEGNLSLFIAAGSESTAATLSWALYLLSLDPEWRERVEEEVDREAPGGTPDPAQLHRLVAVRAVIDEALRLYPPVASINRQALAADRLADVEVPEGSYVVVSNWVLHRHRRLWKDPEWFDPSRFLPEAGPDIPKYAYLPFGLGPRSCTGARLAMISATMLLASLVRRFRFELPEGQTVEPVHLVTLHPKGRLPMRLHHRS